MNDAGPPVRTHVRRAAGSIVVASVAIAGVVLVILVAIFLTIPVVFTGVISLFLGTRDGDAVARANVEQAVSVRVERLGYWYQPTDAETMASERLSGTFGQSEFTPFAWSGDATERASAVIDVFVESRVPARSGVHIGEREVSEGSAHSCYRFTFPSAEFVTATRIDCPEGLSARSAPTPTPTVAPHLPDDAREIIAKVLADPSRPALAALRAAFDDPALTVDLDATDDGEVVVAVGAPASAQCILVVKLSDGTLEEPGYDPVWILPGETGCSTRLYTAPPS